MHSPPCWTGVLVSSTSVATQVMSNVKAPAMVVGDALILTATSCEKRHFVHDTRATDETIIAVLHNDGNGIVVDISPKAQNIETQQCYTSLFEAFCHLDEQFFDKAM
ncbi:MAG: hypothetical protein EBX04_09215 [Rhodobacteraceae bacterium]|nr:hypothetical protein [Paracoccaceae bacterium]NCW64783.1 hypothetical protein [Paracoccaceae bacterium]NCX84034.1 hypothetical protein [Paracoccaceae bacterium]